MWDKNAVTLDLQGVQRFSVMYINLNLAQRFCVIRNASIKRKNILKGTFRGYEVQVCITLFLKRISFLLDTNFVNVNNENMIYFIHWVEKPGGNY